MQQKIKEANQKLKDSKLGVSIQQIGNRLYLQATLPPKPDSLKTKPHQQKISLGVFANGAGLQYAQKEARKLGDAIAFKLFNWKDYLIQPEEQMITVGILIKDFEKDYFNRRPRNSQSEYTFEKDYLNIFKKLDQTKELNKEDILEVIFSFAPDSRSRKRSVMAFMALVKFANFDFDIGKYKGEYNNQKTAPRDLPSDKEIHELFFSIKNPQWQWAYGILATFGLRPHEIFLVYPDSKLPILEVDKGKTKERKVWALHPEWVSEFDLQNFKIPNCSAKNNAELGHRVSVQFRRYNIPFKPYDLRHKWAVRAIEFGLDVSLASQQMGHSVKVHCEVYQRWIGENTHQRAYDLIINNPYRPMYY
jgi:integrase